MQQPMYLPNGYMMSYYPQAPPGHMPMYGAEDGSQGRLLVAAACSLHLTCEKLKHGPMGAYFASIAHALCSQSSGAYL